jgi:hypothetical protein
MRAYGSFVLVVLLCGVPTVTARASSVPPSISLGQCLPVIITGQGAALRQETPVAVVIDIQPNRTPNKVYLTKNYTIYVAVFGSAEFAVTDLDPATIAFGRTGKEAVPVRSAAIRDMNGDGFDDALYGFMTSDCGFELGNKVGWLRGAKTDETAVEGSDAVVVSP